MAYHRGNYFSEEQSSDPALRLDRIGAAGLSKGSDLCVVISIIK